MTTKRAKLNLRPPAPPAPTETEGAAPAPAPARKPAASRNNTKWIGGHYPFATWLELTVLVAKRQSSVQELLGEAITDLLAKHREQPQPKG
jgi:hypothetical protein